MLYGGLHGVGRGIVRIYDQFGDQAFVIRKIVKQSWGRHAHLMGNCAKGDVDRATDSHLLARVGFDFFASGVANTFATGLGGGWNL